VGPDVPVLDHVRGWVAEVGQYPVHTGGGGDDVVVGASLALGGWADVAQLPYAPSGHCIRRHRGRRRRRRRSCGRVDRRAWVVGDQRLGGQPEGPVELAPHEREHLVADRGQRRCAFCAA
jgi:hypothetical protein